LSDIELDGGRPRLDGSLGQTSPELAGAGAAPETVAGSRAARNGLAGWIESRSGLGSLIRTTFDPLVPCVSRWRYALGAALVSCLAVEFFTGILLMFSYSPSAATAWGSTFYIDHIQSCGWFLRGLHNFTAQAMIVVSALHLASVVVAGVYRTPREMNWWLGLAMLGVLVAFTLSGNALVWDQDGYWAWHVETGIAGGTPVVGPLLQRVIIGGTEMGNATVSRLYAFHISILPILVLALLAGHVALSRRHALIRPAGGSVQPAWPTQVFFNILASAVLLVLVTALVVLNRGVSLEAPADPASAYPARPAWFFFWLFELRKSFHGPREIIATMVIPGALTVVTLLLPFFDRALPRRLAHFAACSFAFAVLLFAGYLTARSIVADFGDPDYREGIEQAEEARVRAVELALSQGVPPEGASALLGRDPLWHGRALLKEKCLGCHVFDTIGEGEQQTAPDLRDFGTRAWVRGLLEKPDAPAYFGSVAAGGGMLEWKKSSKLSKKQLDDVADFVATFARIPPDMTPEEWQNAPGVADHPGLEPFQKECGTCHAIQGLSEGGTRESPGLFAYGSPQWITRMIHKPAAPDMYGYLDKKDQMPSFTIQLTDNDVRSIVRYLRNDYSGAPGVPVGPTTPAPTANDAAGPTPKAAAPAPKSRTR
jgi:ubiquinol-cytochrome c reductase cytochrome b subunit